MNSDQTLRIGTRGSRLARWQSDWVAREIAQAARGVNVQIVEIRTQGDRDRDSPLAAIGGAGVFTKELQHALLDGRVDVAVHSLKDLPTENDDRLTLAAVPARADVSDVLVSRAAAQLDQLPAGARVGTSSTRRRAQLLFARPDLVVENVRGNVETRIEHVRQGRLDAVILAAAGLDRLGLSQWITQRLEPAVFLPAVGQGALGIECRANDLNVLELLSAVNHQETWNSVAAERALLAEMRGGCNVPLGAWARLTSDGLKLDAVVLDPDGRERVFASAAGIGATPIGLGRDVAAKLRESGAIRLWEQFASRK